jgi:hypothetical protein
MVEQPYNSLGQIVASGSVVRMGISIASGRTNEQVFNEFVRRHPDTPIVLVKKAIELGQLAADAGNELTDSLAEFTNEIPDDETSLGDDEGELSIVGAGLTDIRGRPIGFRAGRSARVSSRVPIYQLPEAPGLFPDDETDYAALIVTESLNVSGTGELLQYFNLHGFESWQDVIDKALSWAIRVARDYPDRFQQNDQPFDIGLRVILGMRREA